MIYTEADYLLAKLRGEIVPREHIDYMEQQFIGRPSIRVPIYKTILPAETCEQWLSRMNNEYNFGYRLS